MQFNKEHNKFIEAITDVICARTSNTDKAFFRPVTAYFLSKVASNMRATLITKDLGVIPINNYAICLGASGYGKGHSINIIEDEFLCDFKKTFTSYTFPLIASKQIQKYVNFYASARDEDEDTVLEKITNTYNNAGEYIFSFDSGTAPAVKQLRTKLLIAGCGALSFEQDELGNNLNNNTELLPLFLELYDLGKIKQKLIKNTNDSIRAIEIDGRVPTNLLWFGTPTKIFDGSTIEDSFFSMLETGYARRCLFGYGIKTKDENYYKLTAQEIFNIKTKLNDSNKILDIRNHLANLASEEYYNTQIIVPDEVSIQLIEYKLECEKQADQLKEHENIKKAELEHRYFKTLKLAGVFAFLDNRRNMNLKDLSEAITLVEECGESFNKFLQRDPDYVRLAKFILSANRELTHADITEALPWYKTSTRRKESMLYAKSWGYSNNILIKQETRDNIDFFSASTLEEVNLDKINISFSEDMAYNYISAQLKFSTFNKLCLEMPNTNWCNHEFKLNHRKADNVKEVFNVIVLDCDDTISIDTFKQLFVKYTYFYHTTKRHTEEHNRFRIVIPIKYKLALKREAYIKFMDNFINWLPFNVDERCKLPEQKWSTNYKGQGDFNYGELLDPLPFVPQTIKNDTLIAERTKIKNLDKAQAWFYQQIKEGNRNNKLFAYAAMLFDDGKSFNEIEKLVMNLNNSLDIPLTEDELQNTVIKSISKKFI